VALVFAQSGDTRLIPLSTIVDATQIMPMQDTPGHANAILLGSSVIALISMILAVPFFMPRCQPADAVSLRIKLVPGSSRRSSRKNTPGEKTLEKHTRRAKRRASEPSDHLAMRFDTREIHHCHYILRCHRQQQFAMFSKKGRRCEATPDLSLIRSPGYVHQSPIRASKSPELPHSVAALVQGELYQMNTMDSLPSIQEMPSFDYSSEDDAMPFSGGSNV